jgi:hypothetical protein
VILSEISIVIRSVISNTSAMSCCGMGIFSAQF